VRAAPSKLAAAKPISSIWLPDLANRRLMHAGETQVAQIEPANEGLTEAIPGSYEFGD